MTRITGPRILDVRFPSSHVIDGSDAMDLGPDHPAICLVPEADMSRERHGLTFAVERGSASTSVTCRRPTARARQARRWLR